MQNSENLVTLAKNQQLTCNIKSEIGWIPMRVKVSSAILLLSLLHYSSPQAQTINNEQFPDEQSEKLAREHFLPPELRTATSNSAIKISNASQAQTNQVELRVTPADITHPDFNNITWLPEKPERNTVNSNLVSRSQSTSTVSAALSLQHTADESILGQYFLYFQGKETLNTSWGRINFLETTGVIHLTTGSATFKWHIDDEGFYILELDQPIVQGIAYPTVNTPEGPRQVLMQYQLTRLELNQTTAVDGSPAFSADVETTHHYPNGEAPDQSFWYSTQYSYRTTETQERLADLLQINQRFHLPLDNTQTVNVQYNNGTSTLTSVSNRSMRVNLAQKTNTQASGNWEYLTLDNTGKEQFISETVNVVFNTDGSAVFTSASGLTAEVSAFKRAPDNSLLLNVLYFPAGARTEDKKIAVDGRLEIRENSYTRKAPGKYQFRQNSDYNSDFWLEIYEDGTGASISASDRDYNGTITADEITVIPHRWQYTDASERTIDFRRYNYRAGSGKSGVCVPADFAPAPNSDCVTLNSRLIEFYGESTLNNQPIIRTSHIYRFYNTPYTPQEFDVDFLQNISTDNRYFYLIDKRPYDIPERPANDNFDSAITFAGSNGQLTGSTVNATRESGELCHDGYCNMVSVWYRYTTTKAGELTLNFTDSSDFYPNIAVYTGDNLFNLTQLGSSRFTGQSMSWTNDVPANTTVYIAVNHSPEDTRTFTLDWLFAAESQTPISSITFKDDYLKACLTDTGKTYAEEVTVIFCGGVEDLTGIEYFKNLNDITLYGRQIYNNGDTTERVLADLSPLTKLKKVTTLRLEGNKLDDNKLAALSSFRFSPSTYNVDLSLNHNLLTDQSINTISQMLSDSRFIQLRLPFNQFTNLTGITGLTNISTLEIGANPISNLAQVLQTINQLPYLRSLSLSDLNLTSLEGLTLPQNLWGLDLFNNPLSNLEAILAKINTSELGYLNLGQTNISDFSALAGLPLSSLFINNTPLTDLAFVKQLPNLFQLVISNTYVKSLKDLYDSTSLRYLTLWGLSQIPCSELTELRQKLPLLYFDEPFTCTTNNDLTFLLQQYSGSDVVSVEFAPWSNIDFSKYGTLQWKNGVLVFIPKPGVSGLLALELNVKTSSGTTWAVTIYLNIEPKPKKRRGLPLWMLTLPEKAAR